MSGRASPIFFIFWSFFSRRLCLTSCQCVFCYENVLVTEMKNEKKRKTRQNILSLLEAMLCSYVMSLKYLQSNNQTLFSIHFCSSDSGILISSQKKLKFFFEKNHRNTWLIFCLCYGFNVMFIQVKWSCWCWCGCFCLKIRCIQI